MELRWQIEFHGRVARACPGGLTNKGGEEAQGPDKERVCEWAA